MEKRVRVLKTASKSAKCPDPVRECPAESIKGQMELLAQRMTGSLDRVDSFIEKADKTLYGNGSPGLVTRIDRIEQSDIRRERTQETLRKIAVGIVVGLSIQTAVVVGSAIYALVQFVSQHGPVS